jgi:cytochrome c556
MKKVVILLSLLILTAATFAGAAELRPSQKIMQARAGWMKAMSENVGANKLADVAKDAQELAGQTEKVAANLKDERKDLTLKVSSLAKATAEAATKGDAAAVKTKLGEIKGTCATCHEKYRDKK